MSPSVDYVNAPIFLFVSEDSLRTAVHEYLAHYNAERNQERLEEL